MKVIVRGRQMGKTTDLIHLSAETGAYIVTRSQASARQIALRAEELGLNIPFPLNYQEFMNKRFGTELDFLIDDADYMIQLLAPSRVMAMTVTQEREA